MRLVEDGVWRTYPFHTCGEAVPEGLEELEPMFSRSIGCLK